MKSYVKYSLFVVFFIALAGILAGLYYYNLQPGDLQKVKPDFVMTSAELLKAFEDNEAEANTRFVKKIIEVSGIIESVKTVENNALNISLKTESDLSSVICTLTPVTDTSEFIPGSWITLRGECSGFLMDVLLNNCTVITENR
jgi:hypothetical protein